MTTLSVLDQSPVRAGGTPAQAVAETLELARAADRLGYRRYWVAEHHSSPALTGTAPEILVTRIASATERIRVGSGGVMLSHYSPLKVAETFRMIETLFPGRIDLGLGRAPGSGQRTARALQHGPGALGPEHYPAQVADLLAYLEDALPADHPFAGVRAMPTGPSQPEIWILGSSDQSALVAGWFGCAFSFAHFITDEGGLAAMETYRRNFRPSPRQVQPVASLGVFVICADTEAEARRLAASRDLWRLRLDQGIFSPFPPVEEALAYRYSERELARVSYNRRRQIVGAPEQVKESLLELGRIYQVDEFVVVTICYDFAARLRSYELLAEAFGMGRENTA